MSVESYIIQNDNISIFKFMDVIHQWKDVGQGIVGGLTHTKNGDRERK